MPWCGPSPNWVNIPPMRIFRSGCSSATRISWSALVAGLKAVSREPARAAVAAGPFPPWVAHSQPITADQRQRARLPRLPGWTCVRFAGAGDVGWHGRLARLATSFGGFGRFGFDDAGRRRRRLRRLGRLGWRTADRLGNVRSLQQLQDLADALRTLRRVFGQAQRDGVFHDQRDRILDSQFKQPLRHASVASGRRSAPAPGPCKTAGCR